MAMSLSRSKARCNSSPSMIMMPKFAVGLVLLLVILEVPAFVTARAIQDSLASPTRRRLMQQGPNTLAVELMHSTHVDSPYSKPDLSFSETITLLMKSSRDRWSYLAHQVVGKSAESFGMAKNFVTPMYSLQGSYVMQVTLGTPPRSFPAIADTGSDLVWLQCTPCQNCFKQPDPLFDPTNSSSYSPVSCTDPSCNSLPAGMQYCSSQDVCLYSYSYGDLSGSVGALAQEHFSFMSSDSSEVMVFPDISFGCGMHNWGAFGDADGLVGLGRGPLSLLSQLGPKFASIFSYCLVDIYSVKDVTSPLLFGNTWMSSLTFTPLISNPVFHTFYYVDLETITVAGQVVPYPPGTFALNSNGTGGFILDSGTTVTYLYEAAYFPFLHAIAALISYPRVNGTNYHLDLCYDISKVSGPVFPEVVFKFQGLDVVLPANNAFITMDDIGTVCLAFMSAKAGTLSILGSVQQQNFQVSYDLSMNRVGFAPTTCY